jgi:hypothetical protein
MTLSSIWRTTRCLLNTKGWLWIKSRVCYGTFTIKKSKDPVICVLSRKGSTSLENPRSSAVETGARGVRGRRASLATTHAMSAGHAVVLAPADGRLNEFYVCVSQLSRCSLLHSAISMALYPLCSFRSKAKQIRMSLSPSSGPTRRRFC